MRLPSSNLLRLRARLSIRAPGNSTATYISRSVLRRASNRKVEADGARALRLFGARPLLLEVLRHFLPVAPRLRPEFGRAVLHRVLGSYASRMHLFGAPLRCTGQAGGAC